MSANETGGVSGVEQADVKIYSQADVDAMLADQAARANLPGIESGPHLQDPDVRAAKLQQMRDAGYTIETPGLSDDMYAILEEAE